MAFGQHHAGGGHVEREAQHRRHQQDRGEGGEFERTIGVEAHHQNDEPEHDVKGEEDIEQNRRNRNHHHQDQGNQSGRDHEGA